MWEPQRLKTLWASTACYRDSCTFTFINFCTTFNNYEGVRKCMYRIISGAFTPFCLIIWKTIRLHEKMYRPWNSVPFFSADFVQNTFHSRKYMVSPTWDSCWNACSFLCKVSINDFNQIKMNLQVVTKLIHISFMKICSAFTSCYVSTDRQADVMKPVGIFLQIFVVYVSEAECNIHFHFLVHMKLLSKMQLHWSWR
jgi:hypothetical protein